VSFGDVVVVREVVLSDIDVSLVLVLGFPVVGGMVRYGPRSCCGEVMDVVGVVVWLSLVWLLLWLLGPLVAFGVVGFVSGSCCCWLAVVVAVVVLTVLLI
jgi:hypothetical protein